MSATLATLLLSLMTVAVQPQPASKDAIDSLRAFLQAKQWEELDKRRQSSRPSPRRGQIRSARFVLRRGGERTAVKARKMTWTILADERGFDAPIPLAYHVQGTPDIFILEAEGRIFKRTSTAREIEAALQAIAAGAERPAAKIK